MSPEKRLMMAVFLNGVVNDNDWRERDPASYYRIAHIAGVPRNVAETITRDEMIQSRAQFERLLITGEL